MLIYFSQYLFLDMYLIDKDDNVKCEWRNFQEWFKPLGIKQEKREEIISEIGIKDVNIKF